MNFKTTYFLFGLLGLMLVVLATVLWYGPSAPPGAGAVFPSMQASDSKLDTRKVEKIELGDIVFERVNDSVWTITAPRAIAADSSRVSGLLDQLKSAAIDTSTTPPSASTAGLDSPTKSITITAGDRRWTLKLGKDTPGTESAIVYAYSSDRPGTVLAVQKTTIESAFEGLNYFRAKELLGENTTDIRSIKLAQGKKGPVELKKDKDRWSLAQPAYGDVDIGTLIDQITGIRVDHKDDKTTGFVKDAATDLAEYNLDPAKADVLRIDITRDLGGKATTQTALVGTSKKVDTNFYYAAFDNGKTKDVVKIAAAGVEPLQKWLDDPSSFRSKALLALESFRKPDAIYIKNSYGALEFFQPDAATKWQLYRGTSSTNVDDTEVQKLISELNRKDAVTSFPDPKRRKELGLETPDITVKVFSESLEKPDEKKPGKPIFKKDAPPVTELHFGRQEGANVAVERVWGTDRAIVMVPVSLLDQVRKGPVSYFDKTLPSFNSGSAEENVTKVELKRDGTKFVVTRKAASDPWVIQEPAALKNRNAGDQTMRDILGELNRLAAREVVSEKADARELTTYELATAPLQVTITVTKDNKPTTTTFDLGKEVPGKGVYLKMSGKDTVYLVGPETLMPLRRELRDTAVFNFEPEKVTTLTVKGWKGLIGSPKTLVFEQKSGAWTTKEAGYTVDSNKVSELVFGLSKLKLDKFVPAGKGLTLAEDAFEIELTLSDKQPALQLTVGASADGLSYFATSSQLKGDVFQVGKSLFEKAREKPVYFAK